VRIYRLSGLRPSFRTRLRETQMEAARVWTLCRDLHLAARTERTRWPNRDDLQQATKGRFALHSQSVQMICHAFLANVESTRQLLDTPHGSSQGILRLRSPHRATLTPEGSARAHFVDLSARC
jgi:putative transposase